MGRHIQICHHRITSLKQVPERGLSIGLCLCFRIYYCLVYIKGIEMGARIEYTPNSYFVGTRLRYQHDVEKINPTERRALFLCDCGNNIERVIAHVRHLQITSCGCYKSEVVAAKNTKHSHAIRGKLSGTYRTWQAMHQRVNSDPYYKDISICERWFNFENFINDMGDRPNDHTIERKDNLGDYEPSNCIWATRLVQAQNTKNTVKVTIDGETHSISEWCRIKDIGYYVIKQRRARGMSIEDAITTPLDQSKRGRKQHE